MLFTWSMSVSSTLNTDTKNSKIFLTGFLELGRFLCGGHFHMYEIAYAMFLASEYRNLNSKFSHLG